MLRKLIIIMLCISCLVIVYYVSYDLLHLIDIGTYKDILDESEFYVLLSNKISLSGLIFLVFLLNMNAISYVLINDSLKSVKTNMYKFSIQVKLFILMIILNLFAHLLFRDDIYIIVRLYSFIITYTLIVTVINLYTVFKLKQRSVK